MVTNGSSQQLGIDCDETFSPVVKPATIRTVLSLALSRHWFVHQLDVKNTFINGNLSKTVYMHQPPGFVDSWYPNHVCRLQRSLYGFKQAPCAWFHQFAAYATRVGFSPSRCDSSLFIYRSSTDTTFLLIYVDDIVLIASSTTLLQKIIFSLHREFDMTDLGALNYFLGISVKHPTLYRSLAGGLQYLTFTRPDLSYVVQQICLYMHDPREPHLAALKRILRYVQGTLESTSGYCIFLGNNLLSWSFKRQHTLSRSSAEAEYRGVANVVAETAWLRNLLRELHTPLLTATLVYCDNVSDVFLTANPMQHQRTKHIKIGIHFVCDMVALGHVRVLHVPSRYQYADIFTKGLPSALFEEFRTSLSVRLPPAQIAGSVFFDLHPTLLMAKKDMHTYVSRLKDTELETLIATYDIPLDLRPCLPDPNFRMINLPAKDTTIASSSRSEQVMSIYDFLCMPSLDKATVQEEPHELGTFILSRVVDCTISPAPAGSAIPRASLEEIAVTRPDPKVVTKADHAAKRKTSTRPEISTNMAKRTRLSQKVSGTCSSRLAARDGVEQIDDGTLDDGGKRDGSEFAIEDIGHIDDVSQGEHINVIPLPTFDPSLGLDVTYPLILILNKEVEAHAEMSGGEAMPTPDTQPLDTDVGVDEITSDGNVDPYYEARVSNTVGDVLERDLLPFVLRPYYIPYPYDEGSRSEIALDRFPTLAETHRLSELSLVELSDRMSVLQLSWGPLSLSVRRLNKSLIVGIKKHRKYRNERDALALKKDKIKEELSDFTPLVRKFFKSAEFNQAFSGMLNTAISVGVECGLRMDRTDEEFKGSLQAIARLEPDRVTSSHQPSSTIASLRANTHVRHSTSSSGTFGHNSTPEHLKKKKKFVEK
ncbi:ribonuclease H-like domain-containing protein [Tanacetum coccineum]